MPDAPPQPGSPGQLLRAAREAKGLHLAVLSVALKVPTRQLEALEKDDYSAFRGVTFLRALAQSVCRHLGMDPAPVLAGLPQSASPLVVQPPSLDSRVPAAAGGGRRSPLRGIAPSRPVLMLAMLMLVGSAALIWWPAGWSLPALGADEPVDSAQAAVPMGQASNPVEVLPTASETPASVPMAQASEARPVLPSVVPAASAASTANTAQQPAAAALPASAPAPVPVTSAGPVATVQPADAPLTVRPKVDAWIEVRDSKGQMLVKRLVKAGETLRQDTQAPVFVYVGRADSTELLWQGKPVDLKPHTQNNEARLQIKP